MTSFQLTKAKRFAALTRALQRWADGQDMGEDRSAELRAAWEAFQWERAPTSVWPVPRRVRSL